MLQTAAGTLGAAILRRRAEAERMQLVREQSARVEAEAAQRRLAFLAEASQILAASLDYEPTLQGVANLVVPGAGRLLLRRHARGRRLDPTRRLAVGPARRRGQRAGSHRPGGVIPSQMIRTRRAAAWCRSCRRRFRRGAAARSTSALTVPLVTRAASGARHLAGAPTGDRSTTPDLDLAQDLARRCSLAIDNARLYREARAAVSIRDEFLSVAAHELKTPMTSLRGYAQLLGREFDRGDGRNPERARRAAMTIQVQSDKLARLVAQLLDVSRMQSGKLALERRVGRPRAAGARRRRGGARSAQAAHARGASCRVSCVVAIDPLRIEQVVTNLIDNAIKYSPEGGQIDVRADVRRRPTRPCAIVVRDRGVGVPPEHRAHIFDRFYQAHAGGPLTSMAGMGLGLYISRQIVELHGGSIDAEFPEDGGTRFVVRYRCDANAGAGRTRRAARRPSG